MTFDRLAATLAALGCLSASGCASLPGLNAPAQSAAIPEGFERAVAAAPGPAPVAAAPVTTQVAPAGGAPVARAGATPASVMRVPPRSGSPEAGDGLGPLDSVTVEVLGIPDLTRSAEIDSEGQIQLPLIGAVRVEGMTPNQAASEIERRYRGRYIVNPSVSVRVTNRAARLVAVTGGVVRPGVYAMSGPTSLLQAIALGGGLAVEGTADQVQLLRASGNTDTVLRYSLEAIQSGRAVDPWLIAGDRVIVTPEPRVVTVAGHVRQPGVFPYSGAMSLARAIALGGGQLPEADLSKVSIISRVGDRDVTSIHDLGAVLAGRGADPILNAGDRVIIGARLEAVTVTGAVGEAAVVPFVEGLSLSKALAEANGLTPTANRREVAVLRMIEGQLRVARFDVGAINEGTSPDPLLRPGDRVVVDEQRFLAALRDYAPLINAFYLIGVVAQQR
jgi:polysaccharide biosynthesis/export protein